MQQNYFGIDFGTTNTAVVRLKIDESFGKQITRYGEDGEAFPSLLAINSADPDDVLFGREVKIRRQELIEQGYRVFSSFKIELGESNTVAIAGRSYTAADITGLFLQKLKAAVDAQLQAENITLDSATFAIPIGFTQRQRSNLRAAAQMAGIETSRFVSEPTAAYIACISEFVQAQSSDSAELRTLNKIAVFDWGGGTLDISVLDVQDTVLTELALKGVAIGGDSIDKDIAKYFHEQLRQKYPELSSFEHMPSKERDEMLGKSETVKIELSTEDFYRTVFGEYGIVKGARIPLELSQFNELIKSTVQEALDAIYATLAEAKLSAAQLDALIMVGGSSEMRLIRALVERDFANKGVKVLYPPDPQWTIALGAALIHSSHSGYRLGTGVGVLMSGGEYCPLLEQGQPIPCSLPKLMFGLVTDSKAAQFVFVDDKLRSLAYHTTPTKGFSSEVLEIEPSVNAELVAVLGLQSTQVADSLKQVAITGLKFYYDMSEYIPSTEQRTEAWDDDHCWIRGCMEPVYKDGYCAEHFRYSKVDDK